MPAPRVVAVGLGPAGPELTDPRTRSFLLEQESLNHEAVFLRTKVHPAAAGLEHLASFDELYEQATDFPSLYEAIVDTLLDKARTFGQVVYATPGSPLVAEATIELLRQREEIELEIRPALSFLDLAWLRLGIDPIALGARLVDAASFESALPIPEPGSPGPVDLAFLHQASVAGEAGPFLVTQVWSASLLSAVKLALEPPEPMSVTILARLGLPDEEVFEIPWDELDRQVTPDHLSSLWIPRRREPVASQFVRLERVTRILRQRCPWDREQTHSSLRRHLLEESYETLEALDEFSCEQGASQASHLEEELGDLLFQVVLHCVLGSEEGWFDLSSVSEALVSKLISRHPHVFGDVTVSDAAEVMARWEVRKLEEKGRSSVFEGIPPALPALALADKVYRKARSLGADLAKGPDFLEASQDSSSQSGLHQCLQDFLSSSTLSMDSSTGKQVAIGELLMVCVGVARSLGVDPESALRWKANQVIEELEQGFQGSDSTN
jgi:tetrapyrrole methylase family protein/MazG family protein